VVNSAPTRVAVVGLGNVGATLGYALLLGGLAAEIVLIDNNHAKAEGEAMDLNHAVPFAHPTRIWAGDYHDCASATVVVIAAGANQKPGGDAARSAAAQCRHLCRDRATRSRAQSRLHSVDCHKSR
jgi:L-lactate dehydrogenase